jgi:hypothetical protein
MLSRKSVLLLFLILMIVSCNKIDKQIEMTNSTISESEMEMELREVVLKVMEDANNSNIPELKSAHLQSPKFSKFGPRTASRQGFEQTNKSETEHFQQIKDTKLVIEDLKIDIFENVGIATYYNNYSFIKNDNRIIGKSRVTLVFIRTEEGWKIVHEHSSPFNE